MARWQCLCAELPRVQTRTRVLIVRHFKERHLASNTARMAHLALPNSELLDYGDVNAPLDSSALAAPGTALLFPGEPVCDFVPERLVVIDGTWRQARKMARRIPELATMPRFSLRVQGEGPRMRRAPGPEHLATLEAIGHALLALEGQGEELLALFALQSERMWRQRGRSPSDPYGEGGA